MFVRFDRFLLLELTKKIMRLSHITKTMLPTSRACPGVVIVMNGF
jgi:hypothetical protein